MFSYRRSSQYQLSQELTGGTESIHQSSTYHAHLSASSKTLELLDQYNASSSSSYIFSAHDQNLLIIYHLKMLKALAMGLQLPHEVCISAMMYIRRFYAKNTIHVCDPLILVPTALLLASKIEEYPVNAQTIVAQWGSNANVAIGGADSSEAYNVHDVLHVEKYLMGELRFQMVAYHPFGALGTFVKDMHESALLLHRKPTTNSTPIKVEHPHNPRPQHPNGATTASSTTTSNVPSSSQNNSNPPIDEPTKLYQYAWNILNDSYFSDVIILYPPSMLALASIYMTTIIFESEFEENFIARVRRWFEGLNVSMKPIGDITDKLLALYETLQTFDRDVSMPLLNLRRYVSSGHRYTDSRSPGLNTISPHISPPSGSSNSVNVSGGMGGHRMPHRR